MNHSNVIKALIFFALAGNPGQSQGQSNLPDSKQPSDTTSRVDAAKLLVNPDWLAKEIDTNDNLRIIDLPLRKTNYLTGHIPGAVFLDWRADIINSERQELYRLPSQRAMEKLLSRIGVSAETTIVLTDNLANRAAVRMYYTLKYFGHEDVRILNGGTEVWKADGGPLSKDVPKIRPSVYRITETHDEFVDKLDAVQAAIDNDRPRLIDGRPAEQYSGIALGKAFHTGNDHQRPGHIPSAVNIPWSENLNPDGTFKSIEELRALYQSRGIDTDGQVITYCNEGLHAAMPWFVLKELLGNKEVTVYDDSLAEWANRDDTPLQTGTDQSKRDR